MTDRIQNFTPEDERVARKWRDYGENPYSILNSYDTAGSTLLRDHIRDVYSLLFGYIFPDRSPAFVEIGGNANLAALAAVEAHKKTLAGNPIVYSFDPTYKIYYSMVAAINSLLNDLRKAGLVDEIPEGERLPHLVLPGLEAFFSDIPFPQFELPPEAQNIHCFLFQIINYFDKYELIRFLKDPRITTVTLSNSSERTYILPDDEEGFTHAQRFPSMVEFALAMRGLGFRPIFNAFDYNFLEGKYIPMEMILIRADTEELKDWIERQRVSVVLNSRGTNAPRGTEFMETIASR